MRKIILFIFAALLLCAFTSDAVMIMRTRGGGGARVYVFEEDFEGSPSWDGSNGTQDCDGYDADGDICDADTTTYKNGSKGAGLRGDGYYYYRDFSTTDLTEFYADWWFRSTAEDSINVLWFYRDDSYYVIYCTTNATEDVRCANRDGDTVTFTDCDTFTLDTWWHFRLFYKEDTGAPADGIMKLWMDTTDTDFDGDAACHTDITVNTSAEDLDRIAIHSTGASGKINYYDDVYVWETDGDE